MTPPLAPPNGMCATAHFHVIHAPGAATSAVLWLVTASPTQIVAFITAVTLPTCVKVTPSVDQKPVKTLPLRTRRTHPGTAPAIVPADREAPPVAARYCMAAPFSGDTIMSTCREFASVDSRNITPAFAH